MDNDRSRSATLILAALAAVVAFGAAGCTASSTHRAASAPPIAPVSTTTLSTTGPSASPSGVVITPPAAPSLNPSSPIARIENLAAIVVTAKASSAAVVELHDIAVSAGHSRSIPANVIPGTAKALASKLSAQVTVCQTLHPAASSTPGQLSHALDGYATLAKQLVSWNAKANRPLAATFFSHLATVDAQWKAAMSAVGAVAGQNLLSAVPPLLFPKS